MSFLEIVILRSRVTLAEPDVAITVKVDEPALVGVPEITPDELSDSPEGREPELIDHVAPEGVDARVALYDEFTVPEGRLVVVIVMLVGAGVLA